MVAAVNRRAAQAAPTGPNRYAAALALAERGDVTDFKTLVAAVAARLAGKHARSRAINAVNGLIRRGNIVRDGENLRLVQMPGRPLTPTELARRKADRMRKVAASRRAVRIPPPRDQDEDDIVLGVGKFADWSPRSLLGAGRADYLAWLVTRDNFRNQRSNGYRAACAVLGDYLKSEALRP